jgi:hypothetical protein
MRCERCKKGFELRMIEGKSSKPEARSSFLESLIY